MNRIGSEINKVREVGKGLDGIDLSAVRGQARIASLLAFVSVMATSCVESDSSGENNLPVDNIESREVIKDELRLKSFTFHSEGVIAYFEPLDQEVEVDVIIQDRYAGRAFIGKDGVFDFSCGEVDMVTLTPIDGFPTVSLSRQTNSVGMDLVGR